MNAHPYLRAYMAGVFTPSLALLITLTVFVLTRLMFHVPIPVERVIIFPMALVPNAFGIWEHFLRVVQAAQPFTHRLPWCWVAIESSFSRAVIPFTACLFP